MIPSEIRKRLGLKPGDRMALSEDDGELRLRSLDATIDELRGAWAHIAPGRSLVDELIAERREEAARE